MNSKMNRSNVFWTVVGMTMVCILLGIVAGKNGDFGLVFGAVLCSIVVALTKLVTTSTKTFNYCTIFMYCAVFITWLWGASFMGWTWRSLIVSTIIYFLTRQPFFELGRKIVTNYKKLIVSRSNKSEPQQL